MAKHITHHIGIVACSAEGAALCYRTICVEGAELMGAHNHPESGATPPGLTSSAVEKHFATLHPGYDFYDF